MPNPSPTRGRVALLVVVVLGALLAPVTAQPATAGATVRTPAYAPLDRPGPKLSVPVRKLAAALKCHGNLRTARGEPVLLNPATGVTPDQNYSWNYERAFDAQHRAWCAITMPFHTLGDIQTAGEYLVYAIRRMHARAGRRIAVMGHSQGGMSMRWALRFWPGTRKMVDDVIGMAGSNHGTDSAALALPKGAKLPPASLQQGAGSNFIKALNSRAETFRGISYTEIFSHTDEVVQPNQENNSSSSLHTGAGMITNVSTQSICPGDVDEHLTIGTIDPTTYALVMDALTHRGPAKPSRIGHASCSKLYQPGVDPANVQNYLQILQGAPGLAAVSVPFVNLVGAPEVTTEPALRCYVFARACR